MRITFLGTCSGTWPVAGRRHTSFTIEHAGGVYWFDAGESCSYTAYLAGIDLPSTRAIFISHTHMDHVGGLPLLLGNINRVLDDPANPRRGKERLKGKTIKVHMPDPGVWDGLLMFLEEQVGGFHPYCAFAASPYEDGLIYNEHGFVVTAKHNRHMGEPAPGEPWRSFSFRIETEGSAFDRAIVYSGDVQSIEELAPFLDDCDLLLMETGHHRVEDICHYLANSGKRFGRLGFIHHGLAMLDDPEGELAKAQSILGSNVFRADDGLVLEM